jgi:hypothetical protein
MVAMLFPDGMIALAALAALVLPGDLQDVGCFHAPELGLNGEKDLVVDICGNLGNSLLASSLTEPETRNNTNKHHSSLGVNASETYGNNR